MNKLRQHCFLTAIATITKTNRNKAKQSKTKKPPRTSMSNPKNCTESHLLEWFLSPITCQSIIIKMALDPIRFDSIQYDWATEPYGVCVYDFSIANKDNQKYDENKNVF